jgi:hypothetical protein
MGRFSRNRYLRIQDKTVIFKKLSQKWPKEHNEKSESEQPIIQHIFKKRTDLLSECKSLMSYPENIPKKKGYENFCPNENEVASWVFSVNILT